MSSDTSQIENKPIEIGTRKKLKKRWFFVAVCILIVSGALITKPPFVEGFFGEKAVINFDDYKTEVGHTTENNFGKLTLNEVIVDDNQLLLNATFVPENGIDFDYQIFFFPQVLVNGQDYTVRNRGQSIEQRENKYTIYSSIQVSELPKDHTLTLDISYNKWNLEQPIDQPWDFQVDASQKNVQADKKIISINETITLTNGNEVKVTEVVSTPISTTIYYQLGEDVSETVSFKIKSASGKSWIWNSGFTMGDEQDALLANRFDALYLTEDKYFLVPIGADDRELGPPIQVGK
ncbi:DUF4179 domain-containing protein [Lysinibacillus sp. NPDC096418]|uniref:DUF4179 domain-containing protein n=1 Tax=Lysinibacillus sp. NPDC096418 TaxID=3364138 RepID=UPI00381E89BE